MNLLQGLLQTHKKLHFSLIDPDKQPPLQAGELAKCCESFGTNAIMVGGTTVKGRQQVFDTVEAIKHTTGLPIILFPNSAESVTKNADYIFFMILLNAKDDTFRIGEQAKGAPLIKQWGLQPISMGYTIVSTSSKPTTVERHVKLDRIEPGDIDKAVSYALYAQMSGMSCVYFEAGSGAETPIPTDMIQAVRKAIDIPIIVGGGIYNGATAREKIKAGADVIVTGTIIEQDEHRLKEIIHAIHTN